MQPILRTRESRRDYDDIWYYITPEYFVEN